MTKNPQIPHDSIMVHPLAQLSFCPVCVLHAGIFFILWQQVFSTGMAMASFMPEKDERNNIHTNCKTAKNFTRQIYSINATNKTLF